MGALVVYDCCAKDTFDHVVNWVEDARSLASPDIVLLVVGNKTDAADEDPEAREVSFMEGAQLAQVTEPAHPILSVTLSSPLADCAGAMPQDHNVMFLESSAKTGVNVK